MRTHLFPSLFGIKYKSTVRCAVCGGWEGEWGETQGVGPMCYWCWLKGGKL